MAYATLADIFLRWGETNVRDAANFNADVPKSAAVTNRIKHFLQIHSDEIEARLLGCAYKVPFDPVPPVIRTLCVELAYIAMYRVRHSTDTTAPDPFMYVTQRHHQIFADIHARRLRLGSERQSVDVPMVVGGKSFNVKTKKTPMDNLAKIHTDGTLRGDGTKNNPLSVVNQDFFTIDPQGVDVSHLPDCSFVAIGADGFITADLQHPRVVGFKVGKTILTQGIVKNDRWNWNVGEYVMLGNDGLTQTAGEPLVRVGVAISPHLMVDEEDIQQGAQPTGVDDTIDGTLNQLEANDKTLQLSLGTLQKKYAESATVIRALVAKNRQLELDNMLQAGEINKATHQKAVKNFVLKLSLNDGFDTFIDGAKTNSLHISGDSKTPPQQAPAKPDATASWTNVARKISAPYGRGEEE